MIIHLNGMPGVGKFTIAKALSAVLHARLIDNHRLIDLVTAIHERGGQQYFSMLEKLADIVMKEIAEAPASTFIFTNCLSAELPEDRGRLDQISQFAKTRSIPFVQVLLNCGLEENKRRIVSKDRELRGKLIKADDLDKIHGNYTMYHPPVKSALEIDISTLSAMEAAERIKDFVEKIKPG
jgi:deoxyadenosine/deoxycytidine kinase